VFYCGLAADADAAAAIPRASATATVSSVLRPNGLVFFLFRNSIVDCASIFLVIRLLSLFLMLVLVSGILA
jgi:hypothetical protein